MPNISDLPPREFWQRIGQLINGRLYSFEGAHYATFSMRDGSIIRIESPVAHVIEVMAAAIGDIGNLALRVLDSAEETVAQLPRKSQLKKDVTAEYRRLRRSVQGVIYDLPSICLVPACEDFGEEAES